MATEEKGEREKEKVLSQEERNSRTEAKHRGMPGEKTQGKVRKTKTLLCFYIVEKCYSKGEKPKGVFIEKGKKRKRLTLDY